jgi:hypothetical protein
MYCLVLIALLCALRLGHATSRVDFVDPTKGGGSWLDNSGNSSGEPLNVIRSSQPLFFITNDKCLLGRRLRPELARRAYR